MNQNRIINIVEKLMIKILLLVSWIYLISSAQAKADTISIKPTNQTNIEKLTSTRVNDPQKAQINSFFRATKTSPLYETMEWTDLLPPDDLEALLNPPEYIKNIEENSAEDTISNPIARNAPNAKIDRYQQALSSSRIVSKMNGKAIRIPGFIVPLEFDDMQTITQFFLVPWFGACIHLPPPPPNQIILTNYPEGLKLEALYDPFWISGILKTSLVKNELAAAAYIMEMHSFEPYSED